MNWKEIAKFFSGFEAFHAAFHAYLWTSGTAITLFGLTFTPAWHMAGGPLNALIALALGYYAWGRRHVSSGGRGVPA
ncbi:MULTISPECIES: hypothetical protein [unclassified Phenylobacterium]|jgi:hypothetical protein|uniref:hypothetical protein n=1 Tax=unclassified Phenylobacterium TaxID=2640670 RepID=UPI00083B94F5|nr:MULTISPECIES: hypothetical protein [unclassified Phenylobacterium]